MDDEKKPTEHLICSVQAAPGAEPDPTLLDAHVDNGWVIGSAYGVPHPNANSILHYFVLYRPIKPDPQTIATVSQDGTVRTPAVPTTGSGVRPPHGKRR